MTKQTYRSPTKSNSATNGTMKHPKSVYFYLLCRTHLELPPSVHPKMEK